MLPTEFDMARSGDLNQLKQAIEANPSLLHTTIQDKGNFCGSTLLHHAAYKNQVDVVLFLLEKGCPVDSNECTWYKTPLAWAADGGSVDAARTLLDAGSEIEADISQGFVALHACAFGGKSNGKENSDGYCQTAKLLVERGTDKNHKSNLKGLSPLQMAIKYENAVVADYLKSIGAE